MKGKNKNEKQRINIQQESNKNLLEKQIENLNKTLAESNIREFAELLGNSKKLLWKNLIAGISRGIGIGIGVTVITAILIILLQKIVTLNIPVIRRIYSGYCGDCAKK